MLVSINIISGTTVKKWQHISIFSPPWIRLMVWKCCSHWSCLFMTVSWCKLTFSAEQRHLILMMRYSFWFIYLQVNMLLCAGCSMCVCVCASVYGCTRARVCKCVRVWCLSVRSLSVVCVHFCMLIHASFATRTFQCIMQYSDSKSFPQPPKSLFSFSQRHSLSVCASQLIKSDSLFRLTSSHYLQDEQTQK